VRVPPLFKGTPRAVPDTIFTVILRTTRGSIDPAVARPDLQFFGGAGTRVVTGGEEPRGFRWGSWLERETRERVSRLFISPSYYLVLLPVKPDSR
jgi:hypothetical protein